MKFSMTVVVLLIVLIFVLLMPGCAGPREVQVSAGAERFLGGADSGDASPTLGANLVYGHEGGLASDLGVQYTRGDDSYDWGSLKTDQIELTTGLRYFLMEGAFRPYLGAGFIAEWVFASGLGDSANDGSFGLYARAGVDYQLTDAMRVGLDYRATSELEFDLGDQHDVDLDHRLLCLTLGWEW